MLLHSPSILIVDDRAFGRAVAQAVEAELVTLPRARIARASWEGHGAIVVVGNLLSEAPALIDRLAPEHLQIATERPDDLARKVRHAGAIFLGRLTPEAIGDYVAGSNHVLPTSRAARFQSGLSIYDFIKRTSIVKCDAPSFGILGPHTAALAQAELYGGLSEIWRQTMMRYAGEDAPPVIPQDPADKRFASAEWRDIPFFDWLRQSYLYASRWAGEMVDKTEGLDPHTRAKAAFYTRLIASAVSPDRAARVSKFCRR